MNIRLPRGRRRTCGAGCCADAAEAVDLLIALYDDAVARIRLPVDGIAAAADELVSRARQRSDAVTGRLRVGCFATLAPIYAPALIAGVHDAVDRFGTQFASSRGYLSMPGYDTLEDTLSQIFNAHAVVLQTTTLAHHSQ